MSIKKNFAVTVLDPDKINDMNNIISEHALITMRSSSHMLFNTLPVSHSEVTNDITFFQLEAENEIILKEKFNAIIENLNQIETDYSLKDENTGEMIAFVEFLGVLEIKFDNLKIIKEKTYEKIDELKSFKTELGTCKGYKPDFRPLESRPIKDANIKPEKIYLFCHSQENLYELKDLLSEKILEIDGNLILDFRYYTEEDL